jgi:dienelactone hydrolase
MKNEMADKTWHVAITTFLGAAVAFAQSLDISPPRVLVDEVAVIKASGLEPNERVTIRARLMDGVEHAWASKADFVADEHGVADVSKQAPASGSYKGVSAMGLIWSMMPDSKDTKVYQAPKLLGAQTIHFELERKGGKSAGAELEQIYLAEGVRKIDVKGALHGVLFEPTTAGPHPGVLVLGGSEGGAPLAKAAWLASHGFAALALAYFRYEGLPEKLEAIPLEYFGQAVAWMMQRPEIASERVGVLGTSRGGELALQVASLYSQIKAVVAYVPASVRYPACCGDTHAPYAWTLAGRPLPFANPRSRSQMDERRDTAIEVEKTHGPILVISGEDDGVWSSSSMANAVIGRLKLNHFAYHYEHLRYAHAGHRAGHQAITPEWHGAIRHPVSGREVHWGGTPQGNAESSLDASPKVLDFLRQSLR